MNGSNEATDTSEFLQKLQKEAQLQSKLHSTRLLPSSLDVLTSLIGRYSWQILLLASFVTALVLEITRHA